MIKKILILFILVMTLIKVETGLVPKWISLIKTKLYFLFIFDEEINNFFILKKRALINP